MSQMTTPAIRQVHVPWKWLLWLWMAGLLFNSACTLQSLLKNNGEWRYPFPLERENRCYRVVTPFSVENPWDHAHEAIDFACMSGTSVLAVDNGEAIDVRYVDVAGERRGRVTLKLGGQSLRVEYINLSEISISQNQIVQKGDAIGTSATGLHLAVWDEERARYLDPSDFLTLPVPDELFSR